MELVSALKEKEVVDEILEKNLQILQEDRQAINTLLSLSQVQLETSLQANKVLETRVQYAKTSSASSSSKEMEFK